MHYIETDPDALKTLMKGLEILDRINPEISRKLDNVCLYGVTDDPAVLDAAKSSIAHDSEEDWDESANSLISEEDVQLSEIGISVEISTDIIYALLGSGLKLSDIMISFVYKTDKSEEIRSGTLFPSDGLSVKLNVKGLSTIALADSDSYLDDFFRKSAHGVPGHIEHKVRRDSEPAAPRTEESISKAWNETEPHHASLENEVEKFLG
jgi:hypothetical protein